MRIECVEKVVVGIQVFRVRVAQHESGAGPGGQVGKEKRQPALLAVVELGVGIRGETGRRADRAIGRIEVDEGRASTQASLEAKLPILSVAIAAIAKCAECSVPRRPQDVGSGQRGH